MGTIVVKLGGNATERSVVQPLASDLAKLALSHRVAVVHGGGPQTTALQQALGQQVKRVAGRRITDDDALACLKRVVAGEINVDLCGALIAAGASPVGLHGGSSLVIEATRRPPRAYGQSNELIDLGLVGDVVGVNHALLERLWDGGFLPVLACVGMSSEGQAYNINADVVATRLASLLGAEALVLVSDIVGVLRDVTNPESRFRTLTAEQAERAIESGEISGGMIPKVRESFGAIDAGIARIHICGKLQPGQLAQELADPGAVGTALVG